MRRTRGSAGERGAGTVDYLGAMATVVVLVGVVVVAVPSLAPDITCVLERVVATIAGDAPPACTSSEAGAPDGSEADEGGGPDDGVPRNVNGSLEVSGADDVKSNTSTIQLDVDTDGDVTCQVTSDQKWAIPNRAETTGSESVGVTFHSNPGQGREATITITCSNGKTKTHKVFQPGGTQKLFLSGDSYTAGVGVAPNQFPWGNDYDESERKSVFGPDQWNKDDCFRAKSSWGRILADGKTTSNGTPSLQLNDSAFAACTGATTDGNHTVVDKNGDVRLVDGKGNLIGPDGKVVRKNGKIVRIDGNGEEVLVGRLDEARELVLQELNGGNEKLESKSVLNQLDNPEIHDAEVVALSVGGNDVGFADVVLDCVLPELVADCQKSLADANRLISAEGDNGLEARLTKVYEKALEAAPNATIYIVGYPPAVEAADSSLGPLSVQDENIPAASQMISNLNSKISDTVDKVNADSETGPRLVFVDLSAPDSPFNGHSAYSDDPYINEINVSTNWPPIVSSYHQNEKGQDAQAGVVADAVLGK